MIFGESFEEQAPPTALINSVHADIGGLPTGYAWLQSSVNNQLYLRHCYYVLWQSEQISPTEDYLWNIVPALNGQPGAVSFQSTNYPGYYLTISNATGLSPKLPSYSYMCVC